MCLERPAWAGQDSGTSVCTTTGMPARCAYGHRDNVSVLRLDTSVYLIHKEVMLVALQRRVSAIQVSSHLYCYPSLSIVDAMRRSSWSTSWVCLLIVIDLGFVRHLATCTSSSFCTSFCHNPAPHPHATTAVLYKVMLPIVMASLRHS